MSVQLEIKPSVANLIMRQLQILNLPPSFFLSCKQAIEFDLADAPQDRLRLVYSGRESFYEHRSTETWADRRFKLTCEIEWDRAAHRFHLLDLHVLETVAE